MVEDNLTLDCKLTLGVGGIVSFANVVTVDAKCLTTLNCIKDCSTYLVPKDLILSIAESDREFKRYIYKSALYYFLKIFGSVSFNTNLNDTTIMLLVDSSEMITKNKGEVIAVEGGGFLFKGQIKPMANTGANEPSGDSSTPNHLKPLHGEDPDRESSQGEGMLNLVSPKRSKGGFSSPMNRFGMGMDQRMNISAPMLINPLMNGYYKVEEPVTFFSFKNAAFGEDFDLSTGSVRFSLKNQMASMNIMNTGRRASLQRKLNNNNDIDKEYTNLIAEAFPVQVAPAPKK